MSGAARLCRTNGWDPLGLNLSIDIENDPTTRMMTKLTFTFAFPESFTPEQRQAVLDNAPSCYVKKHLETPPAVVIQ
ncbi:MAG: hypothetical protein FWF06_01695 [Symbiobacteriaceae bacterium]|nr:hypothetical protein [Symbiobacteriaceae bacterium]